MMLSFNPNNSKHKSSTRATAIAWGKLSEEELLTIKGHQLKLAILLDESHSLAQGEPSSKFKNFYVKNRSYPFMKK